MKNLSIDKLSEGIQPEIDVTNLGIGNRGQAVSRLLPEIVSDILSRLPIEDVMRSRCICKGWYALTEIHHFVHLHLSRALCLPVRIILEPKHQRPLTSFYLVDTKDGM
ncbi:hypothetical protein IFM89_012047 [Coptis chinensis]|uniref:F-box domain-containing protein n=1 Tax=Coptis chinensis TaxID=261450 RepID=A0A835M9U0_9MAGN|nr:hypothetical protein IFM89_012047 [Coptis chinensis]